ncbi:nucleotide pyrophosphohydrolase [Gaopeijia maritima]|uniref:nucleotide pyrophosphohydrolase n=1 Tax=Gaopeijia maritima TaxID=3119007 RepID=UPI003269A869
MQTSLRALTARLHAFAAARDWDQWHTPKNLAMALIVEAAELVEQYQWLTPEQASEHTNSEEGRAAVADELADIAIYLIRLSDVVGIDLEEAILAKIERNETRFPPAAKDDDA